MPTKTIAPWVPFDLNDGSINAGGFVQVYDAGSVTPVDSFVDSTGTVNTNPIQLGTNGLPTASGAGFCEIYLTPGSAYKFKVMDAALNVLRTQDNILATPLSASSSLPTGGTAGQFLTSNGPATPSSFQDAPVSLGVMTLLKANQGTSTAAGATNVDTVNLSGLTPKDSLLVLVWLASVTQTTAVPSLYNNTDAVSVCLLQPGGTTNIAAGEKVVGRVEIGQMQSAVTAIGALVTEAIASLAGAATFSTWTDWTAANVLALRHAGVTAGGTFQWRWKVYKLAGQ